MGQRSPRRSRRTRSRAIVSPASIAQAVSSTPGACINLRAPEAGAPAVATTEQNQESPGQSDGALWDALGQVVRFRRSNLRIDAQRPVPDELIDRLIELAQWAPNH